VEADAGVTYIVVVDTLNTLAIGKGDNAQLEMGNMNRSLVLKVELVAALLVLAMDHCCGIEEKIAVGGAIEAVLASVVTQRLEEADTGWFVVVEWGVPRRHALHEVVVDNGKIDMPDKALPEGVLPRTISDLGRQRQQQLVAEVPLWAATWQSSHSLQASLDLPWGCRCYLAGVTWYSSSAA